MLEQLGLPPPLVAAVVAPKVKHHKLTLTLTLALTLTLTLTLTLALALTPTLTLTLTPTPNPNPNQVKHHKLAEEGTYAELVGEMGY